MSSATAPAVPPRISYPPSLPVSARREELLAAIRDHQVVIVAGETGSGKTTQLPKICLELGRGTAGLIGHTQPRRIAARTVAERIAEELETSLGEVVGYKVRFTDRTRETSSIKVMTDGILLAEIAGDRLLKEYDTLIIDEAHERSLNIDFILGYLKRLLPRRPDLKVVITSATIDTERFSQHFDGAPIVEVSGRSYPVEIRYRPLVSEEAENEPDRDQVQAICDAVEELRAEGPGDVLVFLSGEREIRDTAEALSRLQVPDTEILPLYARLSVAEQHRVFQPHPGRRIVLATNVAETSLTVPGVRYVVDPGTARISRYSHRLKVQRLPIEAISKASARQRAGRCGRIAPGICIRLYSEEDFEARPDYTEPEILRTNLASVILQMTALGLGDMAAFPFVDAPDRRTVNAGVQLLEELGAFAAPGRKGQRRLSQVGHQLAQLPVDPRMARMVVEAGKAGCLDEILVIAAALSIQDPRERPSDAQQAADEKHARFAEPNSDFLAYLKLWAHLREQQKNLSSNQFRKMCRAEFLNYLRVREWQDLVSQLRGAARGIGLSINTTPASPDMVHRALLAGLLSHIGLKQPVDKQHRKLGAYAGARGIRFAIAPGSALFKSEPRWVMVAELVETSRLWGRIAARIAPEWAEELAPHLVVRSYSEPHWDARRGAVMAFERVTLYGVPLVVGRRVAYGRVDPQASRELFIRHALVEGDWDAHHRFLRDNRALVEKLGELEHRVRRHDLLVDDESLFAFYDERIPAEVVSGRHFDNWWKQARRATPDLLTIPESLLLSGTASPIELSGFPDTWSYNDVELSLDYLFEPGAPRDGVTIDIPIAILNRVDADVFSWLVPGMREELAVALVKSLRKTLRRHFVPAPDCARAALERLGEPKGRITDALSRALEDLRGVEVPPEAFRLDQVPDHLRMTFRIVDENGRVLGEGKDLDQLRRRFADRVRATMAKAASALERSNLRGWTIGTLPQSVQHSHSGVTVHGYPALVDEGGSVAVRVLPTAQEQHDAMWAGTRRLLVNSVPSPVKSLVSSLDNATKLALVRAPHGSATALMDDCLACAVDAIVAENGGPAWDAAGYNRLLDITRMQLPARLRVVVMEVAKILPLAEEVQKSLAKVTAPLLQPAVADMQAQLRDLVGPVFVTATGATRLPDVVRYLHGIERRLEKIPLDVQLDAVRMQEVARVRAEVDALPVHHAARLRWMVEELRISLFAQVLGTAHPVSPQRILKAVDAAREQGNEFIRA